MSTKAQYRIEQKNQVTGENLADFARIETVIKYKSSDSVEYIIEMTQI